MRTVVLLLLVANLVLWGAIELDDGPAPGTEPERIAQQIAPEQLKIVGRGEPPPAPTQPPVQPPAKPAEAASASPPVPLACASYPGLAEATADAIFPLITRRSPELMVARDRDQIHVSGFRVLIDRFGSRSQAQRKARELQGLGVSDYNVIGRGGVWRVSLGVFSTESAARKRLSALRKQGVRDAEIQAISYPDSRERVTASGPADAVARAREAVRVEHPDLVVEECVVPAGEAAANSVSAAPGGTNGSGNGGR